MIQQQRIVRPSAIQVTRPDINASTWIKANIPADATLLVNRQQYFMMSSGFRNGCRMVALSFNTKQTTTQHMMSSVEEDPGTRHKRSKNNLTQLAIERGLTHPDVISSLDKQGISHIYILGNEENNIPWETQCVFCWKARFFKLVYQKDLVLIFEILDY